MQGSIQMKYDAEIFANISAQFNGVGTNFFRHSRVVAIHTDEGRIWPEPSHTLKRVANETRGVKTNAQLQKNGISIGCG